MSKFTHIKKPYLAECYQLKTIDDPEFLAFLEREEFVWEKYRDEQFLRIESMGKHASPVIYIQISTWVRKGENGTIRFLRDEEFKLKYNRIDCEND